MYLIYLYCTVRLYSVFTCGVMYINNYCTGTRERGSNVHLS